jgi:hypothetical protein
VTEIMAHDLLLIGQIRNPRNGVVHQSDLTIDSASRVLHGYDPTHTASRWGIGGKVLHEDYVVGMNYTAYSEVWARRNIIVRTTGTPEIISATISTCEKALMGDSTEDLHVDDGDIYIRASGVLHLIGDGGICMYPGALLVDDQSGGAEAERYTNKIKLGFGLEYGDSIGSARGRCTTCDVTLRAELFYVTLVQNGGAAGNKTTFCTFTYDVTLPDGSTVTTVAVEMQRIIKATMTAATIGIARYDGATLKLVWVDEQINTGACP